MIPIVRLLRQIFRFFKHHRRARTRHAVAEHSALMRALGVDFNLELISTKRLTLFDPMPCLLLAPRPPSSIDFYAPVVAIDDVADFS